MLTPYQLNLLVTETIPECTSPEFLRARREIKRLAIFLRDEFSCRYCGRPAEHLDHIIPRFQGGQYTPDNLVAACQKCNLHKLDRTPEQAGMRVIENGI